MGKTFGYARVSTNDQNLDRQLDMLQNQAGIPREDIFCDKISGSTLNRPAFDELQKVLRTGDKIVSESLSRISRSTKDLLNTIESWQNKGITYVSLKENIDFSTSTGKLILSIISSIAEFEKNTIRDRVCEGLSSARARGRVGGRPKTDKKSLDKAIKLYHTKAYSIKEIKEVTGVSQSVLYRALKEQNNVNA